MKPEIIVPHWQWLLKYLQVADVLRNGPKGRIYTHSGLKRGIETGKPRR